MPAKKAMFGISVYKRSITNQVIADIAMFMAANYDEAMIILVDEPEVHNWLLRGRESKAHAKEVVDRVATERVSGINRILRRYNLSMPVHTWNLISSNELYHRNVAAMHAAYETDPAIKAAIQGQLRIYLSAFMEQAEERLGRPLTPEELDGSAQFLLEELAGLAHLHYDLGYSIDVYPDKQGKVTRDLLTGVHYTQLGKALRIKPETYQYIVHPPLNKTVA